MSRLPWEKERDLLWASGFTAYCGDMIIIVCLPSLPLLTILFKGEKPWGLLGNEAILKGVRKRQNPKRWCVRRGLLLRQVPVTCWPCPVSTLFLHTVTMDFHSNHWETVHTIIMPTWMVIYPCNVFCSFIELLHRKHTNLFFLYLVKNRVLWIFISVFISNI